MTNFQQQADYNLWATGQWIDFIYSNSEHDNYLYKLVNHIIKGERAWLERINNKDWNRDLWDVAETKQALLKLQEANRVMLQQIFEKPLENRIPVKRLNGQEYNPRVMDILQHAFYHSENHRGQLASFSAKAGLKYPVTDYMTFSIITRL
ncbi:MAG TPA: DinB family protein [Mucilaginibacter sp.]